jgi:hypothetical protein
MNKGLLIIIILIVLLWGQYTFPDKVSRYTGYAFDPVNNFLSVKTKIIPSSPTCPETYEPVCGENNQTYNNSCYAALANISNITAGEC